MEQLFLKTVIIILSKAFPFLRFRPNDFQIDKNGFLHDDEKLISLLKKGFASTLIILHSANLSTISILCSYKIF